MCVLIGYKCLQQQGGSSGVGLSYSSNALQQKRHKSCLAFKPIKHQLRKFHEASIMNFLPLLRKSFYQASDLIASSSFSQYHDRFTVCRQVTETLSFLSTSLCEKNAQNQSSHQTIQVGGSTVTVIIFNSTASISILFTLT